MGASTESKALRKSQELPKMLEESSAVSSKAVMSWRVLVVVLLLRVSEARLAFREEVLGANSRGDLSSKKVNPEFANTVKEHEGAQIGP